MVVAATSVVARSNQLADEAMRSCLGMRAARLQRLVGRRFDHALGQVGLTVAQLEVLSALAVTGGARPVDLATWLDVERSTVSRNLALRARRGYVATSTASATGRSQRVSITAAGRAALAAADEVWHDAQDGVHHLLGDDAIAILDTWLAALSPESVPS